MSLLLLCNKLMQISCLKQHTLIISEFLWGQKSGHSLAGSSAQFHKATVKVSGCIVVWRLDGGKICFSCRLGC